MRRTVILSLMLNAAMVSMSGNATAGLSLTGIVTEGTSNTGNYTYLYDWHTASLPSAAYQLWVIQGSDLNGSFINGPGATQSGIDAPLSIGQNTFTVYADHNFSDIGYYGINLAFDGVDVPVISAFAPTQTSASSTPGFSVDPSTSSIRWDDSVIAAPASLSFQSGDELATLTSFTYAAVGVYDADRVSAHQIGSDGILDNVGQFTITVSTVPEPASILLAGMGCGMVLWMRWRGSRYPAG